MWYLWTTDHAIVMVCYLQTVRAHYPLGLLLLLPPFSKIWKFKQMQIVIIDRGEID